MAFSDRNDLDDSKPLALARIFLRDFVQFAGRKGVVAAVFVAFGGLLEGLGLALVVPLIGIVTASGSPFGRFEGVATMAFDRLGIASQLGKLTVVLSVFGTFMVVRAVAISIRDASVAELQTGFVEAQRLRIAQQLAAASWDQVARLRHARISHLMSGDIQRIGAAANFMLRTVVAAVMLLAQCILVLLLAPVLAGLAFVTLILIALVFVPIVRRAHDFGGTVTRANLSLLDSTAQFLGGLKLAVSQNLQSSFVAEFRQTLHDLRRRQVAFMRQQSNSRLAFSTVSALAGGLLVLIGFGVFQISAPTLIALLLVIARMSGPTAQIQQGVQQFANTLPAYRVVKELEQELATIAPQPSDLKGDISIPEGPIVFENVSFLHASEEAGGARGVRDVNLSIEPGSIVGVTGPSGAGKTTFADLLVGLYPPQQGRITVGGATMEGSAINFWRDRISYVAQDAFLFHDSVRRNLLWANPQAGEGEIWDALTLVGAADLVKRMEDGLDTMVGERGTLMSGGERQRLALARAILRCPRLLVLDEATSAIDVAGEREILEGLRALTPRPTIVVIAHRAESLALCDRLLRFEAGRFGPVQ